MNARLLKAHMMANGITAEDMAQALGINYQTFIRKLRGDGNFSLPQIRKMREVLKLSDAETLEIFFE